MSTHARLLVPAIAAAIALSAFATPATAQAPTPPAAAAATGQDSALEVSVTYAGKGEVSTKNEVSIFLFTDPNISADSTPIAVGTVESNGGSFTFTGLPPVVYLVVVYDDKGTYERQGPPEPGTPILMYGMQTGGAAEAVKTGKGAKVAVKFDDAHRM